MLAASCSDCNSKLYVIIYIHTGMVRFTLTSKLSYYLKFSIFLRFVVLVYLVYSHQSFH